MGGTSITLERMLTDPYPIMNSFYIVNGEIQYQYTVQLLDPIPPNPQYVVSLNLTFSAELTYLCTVCGENNEETTAGFISSQSSDTVTLTENNSYILEKSYLIQGREDGMVIMFRFLVTTEDISLTEVFLVLPESNFNNISNRNDLDREDPDPPNIYPPKKIQSTE